MTIFIVGSDTDGKVQAINTGFLDDDMPINYELETQDLDFGNIYHGKKIQNKLVVFSKDDFNSKLQIKADSNDYKDIPIKLEDRVNLSESITVEANKFNFKWLGSTKNNSPVFEGLHISKVTDIGIRQ